MTTCVVTGAAGFIGSHLAERLVNDGHHVVGIDCFTNCYARSIKERNLGNMRSHPRFTLIEGDLVELDLAKLLREVGWVFHLAAQAGVRTSWGNSFDIYLRNNLLTTQRLLEAAKDSHLQKFVFASSSSVYGDAETFPTPENVEPRPLSPYGVTKLACEHLCRLYSRSCDVPTVGLRYFTVYGPRQRPDMAFHRFIRAAIEDREVAIYGDGEQTRDFTYVSDTVDGTVRAAQAGTPGDVYNIGGGSRVSVNQVLSELEKILGRCVRVRYESAQQGDVRHTSANFEKAASVLGYAPHSKLALGLRAQVKSFGCEPAVVYSRVTQR